MSVSVSLLLKQIVFIRKYKIQNRNINQTKSHFNNFISNNQKLKSITGLNNKKPNRKININLLSIIFKKKNNFGNHSGNNKTATLIERNLID